MILSASFAYSSISFAPYYEAAGTQSIGPVGQAQLCGSSPTCVIGTETFDALSTLTLLLPSVITGSSPVHSQELGLSTPQINTAEPAGQAII